MKNFFLLFVTLIAVSVTVMAQPVVKINGVVTDQDNKPLARVTVAVLNQNQHTLTDSNGYYNIYSNKPNFAIKYSLLGYEPVSFNFKERKGARINQNLFLKTNINELAQISITSKKDQLTNSSVINLADLSAMPSPSGNFETILKMMPGVSVNNELSAQYSVRGGNFDENLIYVNDIEINRPVLIRNGQQEGLSFINSELATAARFSSGGFGARYGDKLSSVLDVSYQQPDSSQLVLKAGLMGASLTSKSLFKNSFLLAGLRYKNNGNLLRKQDIKGAYLPNFADFQFLYQYNFSKKFTINVLANAGLSSFKLIPDSRSTQFGTLGASYQLKVDYEGKEIDEYQTYGGGLTSIYTPYPHLVIKWINSHFNTIESERFDINGSYVFSELNNRLTGGFPADRINKGLGGFYNYARNSLISSYFTSELKADQSYNNHTFSVGFKGELSRYQDALSEYNYIDSAGYILPASHKSLILNTISANNFLQIKTFSAFIQDSYQLSPHADLQLGGRINYNSLSKELLISPRLLLAYRPAEENKIIRFTVGIYRQPPSYRSIRNIEGTLYKNQKSQRSYNTSLGYDYAFDGLGTRLKFSSEAYFKYADRLIPYVIDNVRIKYLANQVAQGFTYGADFSIKGEFVRDLVSYFSLSLLKANQDIDGDSYQQKNKIATETIYPKFMRRPSDQRVNFSVFFQDRLFNSPSYKVHLNLMYGSRLPIGSPYVDRYTDYFLIPAYKRVDIGFSKDLLDDDISVKKNFLSRYFTSFGIYVEIFNLFNIDNTVSYLWLKDVDNVSFAIPNYLTGRRINFKLAFKFKKIGF